MKQIIKFLCFIIIVTLCVACDYGDERNSSHPILRKADLLREKGEYQEAVNYYKKYLQNHAKSAYTHLKLAVIYDENLKEPISAIYHYREFLALCKNQREKEEVKLWLDLCEKNLNTKPNEIPLFELPKVQEKQMDKKSEPQNEKIVSQPEVKQLEKAKPQTTELTENKVKISQEKENNTKEEVKQPLDNEKLPPLQLDDAKDEFPKEYIVQKGDTLSGISKKFYKTVKHYKKIMQANNMVNANQLKIGKKIIIPKID